MESFIKINDLTIILAAGTGSRLKPITNTKPKCLVEVNGIPIIKRLTKNLENAGLINNLIVTGYKSNKLKQAGFNTVLNPNFKVTNMVWSLYCAFDNIKSCKGKYVNIFYGDIVVSTLNIKNFLNSKKDFSVMVDLYWEKLWSLRMDDYINDIESLRFHKDNILEIGKAVTNIKDVQGQYIGAIRIKRSKLIELLHNYQKIISNLNDVNLVKYFKNIYMTEFIQNYINSGGRVNPFFIKGGWLEVDSISDIHAYESKKGKLILDSIS